MSKVCVHIAEDPSLEYDFRRLYTGHGHRYHLVCQECEGGGLRNLDPILFAQIEDRGCDVGFPGRPELRERASNLSFESRELPYRDLLRAAHSGQDWVGLERDGSLVALRTGQTFARLEPQTFSLENKLSFEVFENLVFLAPRHGQYGEVFELDSGESLLRIDRGSYHIQHCAFPHAFVSYGTRLS